MLFSSFNSAAGMPLGKDLDLFTISTLRLLFKLDFLGIGGEAGVGFKMAEWGTRVLCEAGGGGNKGNLANFPESFSSILATNFGAESVSKVDTVGVSSAEMN